MSYDHQQIEAKWQARWAETDAHHTERGEGEKCYILDMFPYPSGAGLHVGHPEGYTATDIVARKARMEGKRVLHPMGWDAFGLPAENYAIKTGVHPAESTRANIETFKKQIQSLGFSYDWSREIATCEPEYYRWTQWWFLFLYKQGLAYRKEAAVNWCESCKTVLANEQVVNGSCERCGTGVVQKKMRQWFFRITEFAEDTEQDGRVTQGLISGLGKIDWPESTKTNQLNWIGRSTGAEIDFAVEGGNAKITVFTTRPDTLAGCTYLAVSPEHALVVDLVTETQRAEVEAYCTAAAGKTELARQETKEKTGVWSGSYAVNPLNGERVPVWVADYVLASYGTGAVMAVPAHDERDWEFADKYDLPKKVVISGGTEDECHTGAGTLVGSGEFDGMESKAAKSAITQKLESLGAGRAKTTYRLRDWLVSRQRYWGAPIPIIYCDTCGEVPVPEEQLPVELPTDVDFRPTGESPLESSASFHNVSCPKCGASARRESDTMDTFVCSSWYYFRYADPENTEAFAGVESLKQWCPVDLYVGGAEHTVLHLLYARFFAKVAHRARLTEWDETFQKLRHQGMILGENGEKMSKSKGNVVNPDEIVREYGADTLRVYEMFMGPFEASCPWQTAGVTGVRRFLEKIWKLYTSKELTDSPGDAEWERTLHQTIKKVTEDTDNFQFNTAVSQLMICVNTAGNLPALPRRDAEQLLLLLSPYAPHLAEGLWERLGHTESLARQPWPVYAASKLAASELTLAVTVNGKLRDTLTVPADVTEADALAAAKQSAKVQPHLTDKSVVKEIYVPGKLVNLVVK